MASHPESNSPNKAKRVRLGPAAEHVREELADRYQRLDASNPAGLDLAARALAELSSRLYGRRAELSRGLHHSGDYLGIQLRGRRAIHLAELACLAVHEPAAVAAALAELLGPLGYTLARTGTDTTDTVQRVNAELLATMAGFEGDLVSSLSDGVIDGHEARGHRQQLHDLAQAVARLIKLMEATE